MRPLPSVRVTCGVRGGHVPLQVLGRQVADLVSHLAIQLSVVQVVRVNRHEITIRVSRSRSESFIVPLRATNSNPFSRRGQVVEVNCRGRL